MTPYMARADQGKPHIEHRTYHRGLVTQELALVLVLELAPELALELALALALELAPELARELALVLARELAPVVNE